MGHRSQTQSPGRRLECKGSSTHGLPVEDLILFPFASLAPKQSVPDLGAGGILRLLFNQKAHTVLFVYPWCTVLYLDTTGIQDKTFLKQSTNICEISSLLPFSFPLYLQILLVNKHEKPGHNSENWRPDLCIRMTGQPQSLSVLSRALLIPGGCKPGSVCP